MENTRIKTFVIKRDVVLDFFTAMKTRNIYYEFQLVTNYDTMEIRVFYDPEEKIDVMALVELLDDYEYENEKNKS